MIRARRTLHVLLAAASLVAAASIAHASPLSLDGQNVTVTLQETGFLDAVDPVLVGAGPEIVGNTLSDPIGSILFSSESVDLSGLQIVYQIAGGGGAYTGIAPACARSGCSLWGATPDDASFVFSNLSFGTPGASLQNVSLTTKNVFDVRVSDITSDSFRLIFGSAGILNNATGLPDVGTITMNLDVAVTAVPLPPALPLLLAACLGLGFLLRRPTWTDAIS